MGFLFNALLKLTPNANFYIEDGVVTWNSPDISQPTEEEIQAKIQELQAAEPLRLLRIERNRLLQETDWEITRGLEEGSDISSLKAYRTALRNLPQEIESENIPAPVLSESGELVFDHWPQRNQ